MKFRIGDKDDIDLCIALTHECLRCRDAFEEFKAYATLMIEKGEDRWISYKTCNAYSNFILHLYEFMLGLLARDAGNTKITKATLGRKVTNEKERIKLIGDYISHHAQHILTRRRTAIQNGTAPKCENDISYYPERIPKNFAEEFRKYRNKVIGHVAHERSTLSLSEFYNKYHKYLYMLYWDALCWWGGRGEEFPDLKEITDFTVLISHSRQ
jgi:hypothetical protein